MKDLHAIILAGGKGTRMKSELPKCAYPFLGKPMIQYIIESCKQAGINDIVTIVGYKADILKECLPADVKTAVQTEQLGTGHAAKCAEDLLIGKSGLTLIFPGDMPLIEPEQIKGLINEHIKHKNDLTVVTAVIDDAKSYGRIYRENGKIKRIVEFKDCNEEQKKIKEFNVALYCVDNKLLFETLDKINNNNNAAEYYLTDIVEILGENYNVDSYVVPNDYRVQGFNDVESLKIAELEYLNAHK